MAFACQPPNLGRTRLLVASRSISERTIMPISMRHRLPGLTSGVVFGSGREPRPPDAIHPGNAADQRR